MQLHVCNIAMTTIWIQTYICSTSVLDSWIESNDPTLSIYLKCEKAYNNLPIHKDSYTCTCIYILKMFAMALWNAVNKKKQAKKYGDGVKSKADNIQMGCTHTCT